MPAFSIDSRSLRLFRIGLGLIVLWDLFDRCHSLSAHYVDGGVFTAHPGLGNWTLHALAGSKTGQIGFMVVHALAALAMILNLRPRLSATLTFILTISLQHRNPLVLYGADDVLRLMLLFSLFLPFPSGPPTQIRTAGSVALLTQIVIIFVCAALHKIGNPIWRSGTALYDSVGAYPGPMSSLVLDRPLTFEKINYLVMALQLTAPLALIPALRGFILLVFWGLQVGMALTMNLAMFPFVVFVAWIPFLPTGFWLALKRLEPQAAPALSRRTRLAMILLCGIIIPVGGEIADTTASRTAFFDFYVALGLRQHWRMFTPPPRQAEWTSFFGRGLDDELYDLATGQKFSGFHPVNVTPWAASRWGHLTEAMGFYSDVSENVAKFICRQAPFRIVHQKMISHPLSANGYDPNTWIFHPGIAYICPPGGYRSVGRL